MYIIFIRWSFAIVALTHPWAVRRLRLAQALISTSINPHKVVLSGEMEDTKPEETNVDEQKVSKREDDVVKSLHSVTFKLSAT